MKFSCAFYEKMKKQKNALISIRILAKREIVTLHVGTIKITADERR